MMCAVRMMFPCGNDVYPSDTLTTGTHYIMLPEGNTSLAERHNSPKGQRPEGVHHAVDGAVEKAKQFGGSLRNNEDGSAAGARCERPGFEQSENKGIDHVVCGKLSSPTDTLRPN